MPSETIQGMAALRRRLKALADQRKHREVMQTIGLLAVRYGKQEVPRKTSNLGRTIRLGNVTDDSVQVIAGGTQQVGYAVHVHEGTRPHEIRPRRRKALRWAASPGGARLTGTPRVGAAVRFAKLVRHPGAKANPFLKRGAEKAARDADLKGMVVRIWNRAA